MSELEIVPEQITADAPESGGELADITALIAGDSPEPEQVDDGVKAELPEPDPAELETDNPEIDDDSPAEPPAIDYDMAIPMPDGAETVTLGQLKDHYQQHGELEMERSNWEAHRMEQENQQLVVNRQLNELADLLRDSNPEALKYVQARRQQSQAAEAQALLQVFPEWKDPDVKAAARPPLVETMKVYGFSEVDFAHIDDHRMVKALSDLSRLRAKEAAGKAKREAIAVELPKGKQTSTRKQTAAQAQRDKINRAKTGTESDKLAAIGSLITGQ